MSTLDEASVRRIASLARLDLSDAEVARLGPQLSRILDYVEQLEALDTTGVEPTAFAGQEARFRQPDTRIPLELAGQAFEVPRVI